jgi:hypothetical protein
MTFDPCIARSEVSCQEALFRDHVPSMLKHEIDI